MPLTKQGEIVLKQMIDEYGETKGTSVFYASINKGVKGSDQWHKKRMPRLRSRYNRDSVSAEKK